MINKFSKFSVIDFSATNNLGESDPDGFFGKFVFTLKVELNGFDFNNQQNNNLYDVNPLFYNDLIPFSILKNELSIRVKNLQINFIDTSNQNNLTNLYYFILKDKSFKVKNLDKSKIQNTSILEQHYITFDIIHYFNNTSDIILKNVNSQIQDAVFDFSMLQDFELSYNFSTNNQPENVNIFYKIGAKYKKSLLSKSFKNISKEKSNRLSNIPYNVITTGKPLPNNNLEFDDKKTFLFIERNDVHSTVGLPLINVLDENNNILEGNYYINNDENISSIRLQDANPDFLLHNTSIFEKPNKVNNNFISNTLVTSKRLDKIVESNQLEKNISAYEENFYHDFKNSSAPDNFSLNTLERSKAEVYDISAQKQIKIKMDFKDSCNLILLNTKFDFNYPNPTLDGEDSDVISNTKFINFLNEDNSSYSSHFMPTAYWDFSNRRWSYLEGLVYEDNFNWNPYSILNQFDKTDLFGSKNFSSIKDNVSFTNDIYSNLFDSSGNEINALLKSYKPIISTPGFRNDGSMLSSSSRAENNKSYLSQITSSYGFPYKHNWEPRSNHILDMSNYIAKDFLLEKIIIKGKYTSRGEMPVKNGNFSDGFIKNGDSSYDYSQTYEYKEDHQGIISNNITFFILNDKLNTTIRQNNKKPIGLQSYTIQKEDANSKLSSLRSFNGKVLHDYEGSFNEYDSETNDVYVNVSTFKNSNSFSIDNLNNSSVLGGSELATSSKNTFTYLSKNIADEPDNFVDYIYINENNTDIKNYVLTSDESAKSYSILHEEILESNENTSRELVGYANLLISSTSDNVSIDSEILENIDLIEETKKQDNILNLNKKQKNSFEVFATLKNIKQSDYNSESEYKLRSNYYKQIVLSAENSSFEINLAGEEFNFNNNVDYGILSLITNNTSSVLIDQNSNEVLRFLNNEAGLVSSINALNINNSTLPVSIPYYNFNFFDSLENEYKVEVRFSYGEVNTFDSDLNLNILNPSAFLSQPDQNIIDNPYTSITQYITYGEYENNNETINFVDINFKLFDAWQDTSWSSNFFSVFEKFKENIGDFFTTTILKSQQDFSRYSLKFINDSGLNFGAFINNNPESASSAILQIILSSIFFKNTIFSISKGNEFSGNLIKGTIYTTPYNNGYGYDSSYMFTNGGYKSITGLNTVYLEESVSLVASSASNFDKFANSLFVDNRIKVFNVSNDLSNRYSKTLISFNNSLDYFNPINTENQNIDFSITNSSLMPVLSINNIVLGNSTLDDVNYNIQSYILEGQSLGDPSNLADSSERLIDVNTVKDQVDTVFKTYSGKTINNQSVSTNIIKSNYVLKPTDRLVFGVSSNSNGQVMPTVFELHDELEITLIGRDYEENNLDIVNNQNVGIKKTIVGYDTVNKTGISISQSKNNYFDNVWNSSSKNIENNLSKTVIGGKSSKKFGSINEFITFDSSLTKQEKVIYKKDSILPSVSNLAFNLYQGLSRAEPIYLSDNLDLYYNKSIPKIIFSENIDISSLDNTSDNYNFLYSKIITDWHKVYPYDHTSTKDYFSRLSTNDLSNTARGDARSYSENIDDVAVYFDISSYSLGLNYDKTLQNNGQTKSLLETINNSSFQNEYLSNFKTINSYVLPSTQFGNWQHSIKINNFDKFEVPSKEWFSYLQSYGDQPENSGLTPFSLKKSFLRNDLAIDLSEDLMQENNFYKFGKCTLQYLKNYSIENDLVDKTIDTSFEENQGQWHLVIQLNREEYTAILSELDPTRTYNLNNKELSFIIAPSIEDPENPGNYILADTLNGGLRSYYNRIGKILIDSSTATTNYFLIFPLYFWDTLEVNGLYFNNADLGASRNYENENDIFNGLSEPMNGFRWLGALNPTDTYPNRSYVYSGYRLGQLGNQKQNLFYKPFVDESSLHLWDEQNAEVWNASPKLFVWPKAPSVKTVPYTYNEFLNLPDEDEIEYTQDMIQRLVKGTLFAKLLKKDDIQYNQNIKEQSLCNYKILNDKINYKSYKLLENDLSLVEKKLNGDIDNSVNLSEKVYLSSINKKKNNKYLKTNHLISYKFKWHEPRGGNYKLYFNERDEIFDIDQNLSLYPVYYPYYLVEIKGVNNSHTVLTKNKCLETNLIYDTSKKEIETSLKVLDGDVPVYEDKSKLIRIYEDSLRQQQNISSSNVLSNFEDENLPYFDINLSDTKLVNIHTTGGDLPQVLNTQFLYQVPYTHYKINTSTTQTINQENSRQMWNIGSPIFYFNEENEGYNSEKEINNKSKLFLYGSSTKGKYKYPIESLNRFKYGIENAIPEGYRYYYSSKSFGSFSNKIMGSKNYVHVVERTDGSISNFTIVKSFVNPSNFVRLDSEDDLTINMLNEMQIYNKDIYCRSTKPFLDVLTVDGELL